MSEDIRKNQNTRKIKYIFNRPEGNTQEFTVHLDENLGLITKKRVSYPEWTRLTFNQCANCPLNSDEHPRCPVASNLVDVIEAFKDSISHQVAEIRIETKERVYIKKAALQYGIGSLIGIYMVTSGCPVLDKMRPMVATHLPFASVLETVYRSVSMYLLAQYFKNKQGKEPDWDLTNMLDMYKEIGNLNRDFCERISQAEIEDASLNAVVVLDTFAAYTTFSIEKNKMDEIQNYFQSHLFE